MGRKIPSVLSFSLTNKSTDPSTPGLAHQIDSRSNRPVSGETDGLNAPPSNYLVARVIQDLWAGNTRLRVLVTAMPRMGVPDSAQRNGLPDGAYSGGVDFNL